MLLYNHTAGVEKLNKDKKMGVKFISLGGGAL